jgi:hypothetical protein
MTSVGYSAPPEGASCTAVTGGGGGVSHRAGRQTVSRHGRQSMRHRQTDGRRDVVDAVQRSAGIMDVATMRIRPRSRRADGPRQCMTHMRAAI